jgi:hypothetical protein
MQRRVRLCIRVRMVHRLYEYIRQQHYQNAESDVQKRCATAFAGLIRCLHAEPISEDEVRGQRPSQVREVVFVAVSDCLSRTLLKPRLPLAHFSFR